MFKYVAIGLVAFVAGIAATFAAIGYADEHPDSFLAHYISKVRSTMVGETSCSGDAVACVTPADPSPCLGEVDSLPPLIKVEAQPTSYSHNRLPGAIVINESEDVPQSGAISATEPEPCEVPEQVRKIMLSLRQHENTANQGVEECEPAAPFMPYCEDNEPAPAVMPYAEAGRSDNAAVFAFWLGFFSNSDAKGTKNAAPPKGSAPECKEDPAAHLQYPGVPFFGFTQTKKPTANGKTKTPVAPFEEELQEAFPAPKTTPDFKNLLMKDGTLGDPKQHSHIDTTECRPSDFGFDHLGLRPF
jgi:hypothetical protein